jgi:hypothetical protein
MAEQLVLQHLDHRLSPARCGDEEALQEVVTLLGQKLRVEVLEFLETRPLTHAALVPLVAVISVDAGPPD